MKTLSILSLLMLVAFNGIAQTWEFGSDFNLAQPVGGMTRTMNNAFGMSIDVAKKFESPFALGMEAGFANYGSQTSRQAYTFDDGSVTETDVAVSNEIYTLQLTGKYFLRNNKNINPYISGKAGMTWFNTTLTIEDPADEFSCHPLESDILSRDKTYLVSGGAGVRIDFNTFFRKMDTQRFYFDLSVHSTQGGTVRYMNSEMDPGQPMPDKDVTAKFLNTQTQVIHEHHVGYVYTSLVNMVDYKFGVVFRMDFR